MLEYYRTSWRAVLWVVAGVASLVFLLALFAFPPDDVTTNDKRLDWVGAILVTVGLILLQFVISDGQGAPQGWKTPCAYLYPFATIIASPARFEDFIDFSTIS